MLHFDNYALSMIFLHGKMVFQTFWFPRHTLILKFFIIEKISWLITKDSLLLLFASAIFV